MKKILVSDKEEELIAAIRNYKKSFPRGNPQLLWYAQQLFDEMIEPPEYYTKNKKQKLNTGRAIKNIRLRK